MKRRLYLDLDGVLADFDTGFLKKFGVAPQSVSDDKMWEHINGDGAFFKNLPLCKGAISFYRSVEHLDPIILTACPKTNYAGAASDKRVWVQENISDDATVLPVLGGKNKWLFMHKPGDILIDDFEKNIIPWNQAGGKGILHVNFQDTRKNLREALTSD